MLLDRLYLLGPELGAMVALDSQSAEGAVALVAPGTPGDLCHLGWSQPPAPAPVELAEAGEGDMAHVHVEPHAARIGRDQIIALAGLIHGALSVSGAGSGGRHHARRPAGNSGAVSHAPQKLPRVRQGHQRAARCAISAGVSRRRRLPSNVPRPAKATWLTSMLSPMPIASVATR